MDERQGGREIDINSIVSSWLNAERAEARKKALEAFTAGVYIHPSRVANMMSALGIEEKINAERRPLIAGLPVYPSTYWPTDYALIIAPLAEPTVVFFNKEESRE